MKKLFLFIALLGSLAASAQKISDMPLFTGNGDSTFVPVALKIGGTYTNRRMYAVDILKKSATNFQTQINGKVNYSILSDTLLPYQVALNARNPLLVSGTNIKTINGVTLLGSGNITVATSGGTWGTITGTLSSQSDLQTALNAKQNTITAGSTAQYLRGDFSLATFPTNLSSFTNGPGYEVSSNKDASGGYVGKTLHKINFENTAGTFNSFFINANTASRDYTFQNRSGTIADLVTVHDSLDASKIYFDAAVFNGAGTLISPIGLVSPGGGGSVTSFSAGDLSPLFTTTEATVTTTPALTFSLTNAAAHKFFGNATGSTAAPSYSSITAADLPDLSSTYQLLTGKDASGGYVGKTLHKINFENTAGTFNSFFINANTASRDYTFQNRAGTIADLTTVHDSLDAAALYFDANYFDNLGTLASPIRPKASIRQITLLSPVNNGMLYYNTGTSAWEAGTPDDIRSKLSVSAVDNTSDAAKNAATVALTNKDLTSGTNTFPSSLVTLTGSQALSNKDLTAGTNSFPSSLVTLTGAQTLVSKTGLGLNTSSLHASASLQDNITTKGWLAPRMTTTQRDAISSPATGLWIYNTSTNTFNYYNNVSWVEADAGGGGGSGDMLLGTLQHVTAEKNFDNNTLALNGSTSGKSYINPAAVAGATTFTLPGTSGTLATTGDLSQFAATTSAQLAALLSDETGTAGNVVFSTSPVITGNITSSSSTFLAIGTTSAGARGDFKNTTSTASNIGIWAHGTSTAATGTSSGVVISPTFNETSSGGRNALYISPFFQAGTGTNYVIRAGKNSAVDASGTHTDEFTVTDAGVGAFTGLVTVNGGTNVMYNVTTIGSTANANGMTLTNGVLNLQPASASFGGIITTGTQTFAGVKTFAGGITVSSTSTFSSTLNTTSTLSIQGDVGLTKTNTAAGTTGAQTINKNMGSVNFAAGATTLVVTNSRAATTSNIFLQVEGTDATATSARVTKAAGSFTITLNAAATAETAVSFAVYN